MEDAGILLSKPPDWIGNADDVYRGATEDSSLIGAWNPPESVANASEPYNWRLEPRCCWRPNMTGVEGSASDANIDWVWSEQYQDRGGEIPTLRTWDGSGNGTVSQTSGKCAREASTMDRIGLDWIGLDWIGSDWIRID